MANQPTKDMFEDYREFRAETGSATAAFKKLQEKYGENNTALKHLKVADKILGKRGLSRILDARFGRR